MQDVALAFEHIYEVNVMVWFLLFNITIVDLSPPFMSVVFVDIINHLLTGYSWNSKFIVPRIQLLPSATPQDNSCSSGQ